MRCDIHFLLQQEPEVLNLMCSFVSMSILNCFCPEPQGSHTCGWKEACESAKTFQMGDRPHCSLSWVWDRALLGQLLGLRASPLHVGNFLMWRISCEIAVQPHSTAISFASPEISWRWYTSLGLAYHQVGWRNRVCMLKVYILLRTFVIRILKVLNVSVSSRLARGPQWPQVTREQIREPLRQRTEAKPFLNSWKI